MKSQISEEPSSSDVNQIRLDLNTSLSGVEYRNPNQKKALKDVLIWVRKVEIIELIVEQISETIRVHIPGKLSSKNQNKKSKETVQRNKKRRNTCKTKKGAWKKFCQEVNETPTCFRIHQDVLKDSYTKEAKLRAVKNGYRN